MGERPADPRGARGRHGGPGPQRQPHQLRGAAGPRRWPPRRRGAPRGAGSRQHDGHRSRHGAPRGRRRPDPRGGRARRAAAAAGGVLLRLHRRAHVVCRPRPPRHPPPGHRPARAWLGRRVRDRGPGHRRRLLRAGGRAGGARRHRRGRPALTTFRRADTQGMRVRVRVPGPARHDDQRPGRARGPGGDGPGARQGAPGRRRSRHADPGVRYAGGHRVRPGVRHPVRAGTCQELLCRTHLHRPFADDPPARHPAQAQPAQGRHPRQAPRGRRRLDRPRQHAACARADAAGGRGCRGPCADLVPARALAVLLRHRLRDPRRAHRDRTGGRGGAQLDRCGLARATSPTTG